MFLHRLLRRGHSILIVCLFGTDRIECHRRPYPRHRASWEVGSTSIEITTATSRSRTIRIPEYVIGDVSISLFSKVGNVETFVSSTAERSDSVATCSRTSIPARTCCGRRSRWSSSTASTRSACLQSLNGQPIPPNAIGRRRCRTMRFTNIVLTANVGGEFYNFGERGLTAGYASKRVLAGVGAAAESPAGAGTGAIVSRCCAAGGDLREAG